MASLVEVIPPLESGDRLTRAEFERRYAAMPNLIKAELVEGVVYVSSPVSNRHGSPHFDLIAWLGMYRITTPGVLGSDNGTVRMDLDNEPQPDVFLRLVPECGGQCLVDEDNYIEGAPELIAEVANSSASYDLHSKLNAYRRNQVREYLVWRVRDNAFDWFRLHQGEFVPLAKDTAGV
ncbi:MAG TPA: Uma2 family endonuclease, partial [Pirellulales bacterium]|nr:Uma2 family endonuclease [Pirellulales bacterium]